MTVIIHQVYIVHKLLKVKWTKIIKNLINKLNKKLNRINKMIKLNIKKQVNLPILLISIVKKAQISLNHFKFNLKVMKYLIW